MGTFNLPANPFGWIGNLLTDGESKMNAQTGNTTASAVAVLNTQISASTAYNIINFNCRGAIFYLSVASILPASQTMALKIRMLTDPVAGAGSQPVIAKFAALSASGQAAYIVYPLAVTGALSANSVVTPLPRNYQVFMSVSNGASPTNITFSLSVQHLL